MPIKDSLLEILVCPETKTKVSLAPSELIAKLNAEIEKSSVKNQQGDVVQETLQEGLIREDGAVLFPIKNDIPVMLMEESIPLGQLQGRQ